MATTRQAKTVWVKRCACGCDSHYFWANAPTKCARDGCVGTIAIACSGYVRRLTGLTLRPGECVQVRFSAEIVPAKACKGKR